MNTNMHKFEFCVRVALCISLLLFLAGCPSLNVQRMVPTESEVPPFQTNESIRKIVVSGQEKPKSNGMVFAQLEDIKLVVTKTLSNTGFFDSIDQGQGTLDLLVIVRAQYQNHSAGLKCRGKITITYRFINLSDEIIWAKSYESGFSSNDLGGMARITYCREGAVRENMKAFVRGLRESWPQKQM